MSERRLDLEVPVVSSCRTVVTAAGEQGGRPWVRLRETPFHPEGGGQPSDRGTIGPAQVLDVQERAGAVLHTVDRPLSEGIEVEAVLDGARRTDLTRQHTAQHLISALLADRHGRPTTSFHLGDDEADVEVAGEPPSRDELLSWEAEVNAEIRADRAVRSRLVDPAELAGLPVRTRGLPEGHAGPVRLVEIEGLDLNTCGGTHVPRLGEIGLVHLLGAERARGGTRLRFLAAERVLRRLRAHADREEALKARIGTAPAEFPGVLDAWAAERRAGEKRVASLEEQVGALLAADLAREPGPVLARVLPGSGPALVRAAAQAAVGLRPEAVAVLVGTLPDGEACFHVQSGAAGPADVTPWSARVAALLGARGGGKGRAAQGRKGTLPAGLDLRRALEDVR